MTLSQLKELFLRASVKTLYAKPLSENDNSKNQIYFGPGFLAANLFPNEGIFPDSSGTNPIYKAKLNFGWLHPNGAITNAPEAKLILYPQYPEVRFSGFLRGCALPPSELMRKRLEGRVLFLGITSDQKIVGYVACQESEIALEFRSLGLSPSNGVFIELDAGPTIHESNSREKLLEELRRVHRKGWIESKQLDSSGRILPCQAQQCGGFTLEAELGISKNSRAEPDFLGWEIKQYGVSNFNRIETGRITLMTPEPTGGMYKNRGPEYFIRKFGYKDKLGRADRMNFSISHKVGSQNPSSGLILSLIGFDAQRGKQKKQEGMIALLTEKEEIAASWDFAGLLTHWTKKHSKAAYIPSMRQTEPTWQYCYGDTIRLGLHTDFFQFLSAMVSGAVFWDPGLKLEDMSTRPHTKVRNQFRILSRNISCLYETVERVKL